MNSKILNFIDLFQPLFTKMGIDYAVMRKILFIKLLMDGRRVPTVFKTSKKRSDEDKGNHFLKSLWIYLLMGIALIPFIIMHSNYIFQMSLVFGMIMFFIMTSLISDFSSVLLDIRDKNIIGSRPVAPRTLSMAKTIHILIYMFFITAALTGPALIISIFTQGPVFFLLFLLAVIFIDMFSMILTALVYFVVLRFFDGEKLKDIINYIQIILSFVIIIGYQLIGRLFNVVDIRIQFETHWWQYFIIPIWFSAPFQMIKMGEINLTLIVFTLMAVVIPVIAMMIYVALMPAFEKNLQKLGNNYIKKKVRREKLSRLAAKLLCPDQEERIFFRFATDIMKNEREFKLKVYPTLGFSLIFPFIFMMQRFSGENLKEVTAGKSYFFIYFCGMMLPTLVLMLQFSQSYKAAWLYKALPIHNTAAVFKGTVKALITRLFVPVYLFEAVVFTVIYGSRIVPDLMVVFVNMIILSVICFKLMNKSMPFSKSYEESGQSNSGIGFILLFILAALAGIHYAFTLMKYGAFICLCLFVIITIILWETVFHVPMETLN